MNRNDEAPPLILQEMNEDELIEWFRVQFNREFKRAMGHYRLEKKPLAVSSTSQEEGMSYHEDQPKATFVEGLFRKKRGRLTIPQKMPAFTKNDDAFSDNPNGDFGGASATRKDMHDLSLYQTSSYPSSDDKKSREELSGPPMHTLAFENNNEALREEVRALKKQLHDLMEEISALKSATTPRIRSTRNLLGSLSSQRSIHSRRDMIKKSRTEEVNNLEEDTFSLMMLSKPCSQSWALATVAVMFQIVLGALILESQIKTGKRSSAFDIPFKVKTVVRFGQLLAIVLCFATQSDVLTAIQTYLDFRNAKNWNVLIGEKGNKGRFLWATRILLPNLLKLLQGSLVIVVSFVIIVQSDDIIVLLKDFTALLVISETDNILFNLADYGYLGDNLKNKTAEVRDVEIETDVEQEDDTLPSAMNKNGVIHCNSRSESRLKLNIRSVILILLLAPMIIAWIIIVVKQENGTYFDRIYPNCEAPNAFELAKEHFGNHKCYGGSLNTLGCGFEGGDCINFNLAYPLCKGSDLRDVEDKVGDGFCDDKFKDEKCAFDGGDCCPDKITNSSLFGNGQCNGGKMASDWCGYDKGDCKQFHVDHPKCPLKTLGEIDGSEKVVLGDSICDGGIYALEDCGYEYGDCDVAMIGQDMLFNGTYTDSFNVEEVDFFFSIATNTNGSKMIIGLPYLDIATGNLNKEISQGFAQVYGFNSEQQIWTIFGDYIQGKSKKDGFGFSVAMNSDGNRIAIGAPGNDDRYLGAGHVQIFDFNRTDNAWVKVGQTIEGNASIALQGSSVDMSADGSRLAIASPREGENFGGMVRIWSLSHNGTNEGHELWANVGEIIGRGFGDFIGFRFLRMSSPEVSRVAFSSGLNADASLRVYTYNEPNEEWLQLGDDIPSPYMELGGAAFSDDGNRIVFSSNSTKINAPGQVQVFDFNSTEVTWDQVGGTIFQPDSRNGDGFGRGLTMSSDGKRLAISSIDPRCDGRPDLCATGEVYIYAYYPRKGRFIQSIVRNIPSPNVKRGIIRARVPDNYMLGGKLSLNMDGSWLTIVSYNLILGQMVVNVYDLNQLFYAECHVPQSNKIGNGNCEDFEPYIKEECGFDGGDCDVPTVVEGYPECFVSIPSKIGNGVCDEQLPYNSKQCNFDGGDCDRNPVEGFPECFVHHTDWIGDGKCIDLPPYNSEDCGFDGGDCVERSKNVGKT